MSQEIYKRPDWNLIANIENLGAEKVGFLASADTIGEKISNLENYLRDDPDYEPSTKVIEMLEKLRERLIEVNSIIAEIDRQIQILEIALDKLKQK